MYLKRIQMVGFKSFADKTKIELERGATAIVGPNGCGKSNIADAIRWVLGEQSAKALRGSKMEDCIFNGSDNRKPLGMAEVELTLADCETALDTEYNEVTVSRRVLRSGEGQYFINRTACRLKDIQRLFMDTGIGTTSYSLMEQGRIDRVLSSRPEDRRTIFEEASGITKYKADKKEAIRKLEQTEANLLRLADVIREVKRQIGSLQRQAGKARRYKALQEQLRSYDIYATKQRLQEKDKEIEETIADINRLDESLRAAREEVERLQKQSNGLRDQLMSAEREIGAVLETGVHAKSKLEHAKELIRVNQQRIEEYESWSQRNAKEIETAQKELEAKKTLVQELAAQISKAQDAQEIAETELRQAHENLDRHQQRMEAARSAIVRLREESVQIETEDSRLQNELIEWESKERSAVIQKERLLAERTQLERVVAGYEEREKEMGNTLESMRQRVSVEKESIQALERQRDEKENLLESVRQECATLQSQEAAKNAEIEFADAEAADETSQTKAGADLLLDASNPLHVSPDDIQGHLGKSLKIEHGFELAVEAILKSSFEAVLVSDREAARRVLEILHRGDVGSTVLIPLAGGDARRVPPPVEARSNTRLLDHVSGPSHVQPLLECLLGNACVVDTAKDIPHPVPENTVFVTKDGVVVHGDGAVEFRTMLRRGIGSALRHKLKAQAEDSLSRIRSELSQKQAEAAARRQEVLRLAEEIREKRAVAEEKARTLAQKEGEFQVVEDEAKEATGRLETVTWEVENLAHEQKEGPDKKSMHEQRDALRKKRDALTGLIREHTESLGGLEKDHSDVLASVTEQRVRTAELRNKTEQLRNQHQTVSGRARELEDTVQGKSSGLATYENTIRELTESIENARNQLAELENDVATAETRAEEIKEIREQRAAQLAEAEKALSSKRTFLESLSEKKSELEVRKAEFKMQRQHQIDHITSEYHITLEQALEQKDPEWKDGVPPLEDIEATIEEFRTKMEGMGPVNLVAIEEHEELKERYAFLTQQEDDLVRAKRQLLEMIRNINRTTSDMFRTTFEQVNENFQGMFKKLFNGGSAKLVLVNEEDVLECGIEIIARPPGKQLQNISLLSGGERTLTAVALLFAIYMIKPSPFCLLDELDAALDDTNIGRFVQILQDFLEHSQFIVITHNRQTISAADTLYGITMQEKGVSKVVSMRFADRDREPAAVAQT